jgi:hypothetical protein
MGVLSHEFYLKIASVARLKGIRAITSVTSDEAH